MYISINIFLKNDYIVNIGKNMWINKIWERYGISIYYLSRLVFSIYE